MSLSRPPSLPHYLYGPLCRPDRGAVEIERLRSDRTWVPDDGKPGLAFSGRIEGTALAWACSFHTKDDEDDPGEIALSHTCYRFGAANGRVVPEAGLGPSPTTEATPKGKRRAKAPRPVLPDPVETAAPSERRRVIVHIDPSEACTGLGTWEMGVGPLTLETVRLTRAGYTQADSIAMLDQRIGDAEWAAIVERPPPTKAGFRQAPVAAYRHWLDALRLLARERSARAKVRYRAPLILTPDPNRWRGDLGLPTRGRGADRRAKRNWLKANSVEAAQRLLAEHPGRLAEMMVEGHAFDLVALGDDAAESFLLGVWGSTELRRPMVQVGSKVEAVRWAV